MIIEIKQSYSSNSLTQLEVDTQERDQLYLNKKKNKNNTLHPTTCRPRRR